MTNRLRHNLTDTFKDVRYVDLRGTKIALAVALVFQFVVPSLVNPAMYQQPAYHLVNDWAPWRNWAYGHAVFTAALSLALLLTHRKSIVSLLAMIATFVLYAVLVVSIATASTALSWASTGTGNYLFFALIALGGVVWSLRVVGTNGTVT